jgi:TolA-binding protein
MSTDLMRNRKVLFTSLGILLVAGAVLGAVALGRSGHKTTLPKDLAQAIKTESNDPRKLMETVHEAMSRPGLTDDQRHEIFQNVRTVMEAQMDKRMDEYFAATTESQKQAILDRQIDEMQARMKEWQQRRAQRDQQQQQGQPGTDRGSQRGGNNAAAGGAAAGPGAAPAAGGNQGPGFRGRRGPPSHEERMRHTQSRNPDQSARRMAYFTAMRARAQQRGIQMPWGPPGGR